jgi:hypothetical protein
MDYVPDYLGKWAFKKEVMDCFILVTEQQVFLSYQFLLLYLS